MRIFLKKVWSVVELRRTEVQGSMRVHHHNPNSRPLEGLPFTVVTAQTCNHKMPLTEQHKGERENHSVSYDHEPRFNEENGDGHNESNTSAKKSLWQ